MTHVLFFHESFQLLFFISFILLIQRFYSLLFFTLFLLADFNFLCCKLKYDDAGHQIITIPSHLQLFHVFRIDLVNLDGLFSSFFIIYKIFLYYSLPYTVQFKKICNQNQYKFYLFKFLLWFKENLKTQFSENF